MIFLKKKKKTPIESISINHIQKCHIPKYLVKLKMSIDQSILRHLGVVWILPNSVLLTHNPKTMGPTYIMFVWLIFKGVNSVNKFGNSQSSFSKHRPKWEINPNFQKL